ncbi:MAG: class I SAM-dependent methyltransferase [Acetobacteraceae bacterium]
MICPQGDDISRRLGKLQLKALAIMSSSTFNASDGDGYELQMGRWSRRLAPPFMEFAGVHAGGTVLDVGSGTGALSFALATCPTITAVHGVDFAPPYVAHATRNNHDPRVRFEVGDACALGFPDASFDHALSMLVLQFVPRFDRAIGEMRRVTRPGGTVAAAVWDTRGGFVAYRMFFDTAAMVDPAAEERRRRVYIRPLSRPGELTEALRHAGLQNVTQDMRTIRMDFACFADYWAPNEGKDGPIADYVGTLSPEMKARVRDAVQRAYLDGEADGPRSYAATAWMVKGTVP